MNIGIGNRVFYESVASWVTDVRLCVIMFIVPSLLCETIFVVLGIVQCEDDVTSEFSNS